MDRADWLIFAGIVLSTGGLQFAASRSWATGVVVGIVCGAVFAALVITGPRSRRTAYRRHWEAQHPGHKFEDWH